MGNKRLKEGTLVLKRVIHVISLENFHGWQPAQTSRCADKVLIVWWHWCGYFFCKRICQLYNFSELFCAWVIKDCPLKRDTDLNLQWQNESTWPCDCVSCLSACLCFSVSVCLCLCLSVCLSVSVSLSVSVFLSVCQSVSVCLSICLSVSLTFAYGEFRVQVWGWWGRHC